MRLEGLAVPEGVFVDEGNEAVEFEEGVLERSGGEEELAGAVKSGAQGVGGLVVRFVNVAQAMGFIDDDEIPGTFDQVFLLVGGKLEGADDDFGLGRLEGVTETGLEGLVELARLEDFGRKVEFLGKFDAPLLAQGGGHHEQDPLLPLGPELREEDAGLDCFPQANLVGQDGPV